MITIPRGKILPEVVEKIKQIREQEAEDRLDVIIAVHRDYSAETVKDLLIDELGVDSKTIRSTDTYVSCTLSADQVKGLEEARSVFKVWLDRKTRPMGHS